MTARQPRLGRREAVAALAGFGLLAAVHGKARGRAPSNGKTLTVYRDPGCGCCVAWARIAERAGYRVQLVERSDMMAVKARLGVPEALASCHTSVAGGYAIEGHVPLAAVARLIAAKPKGVLGIAVPGMPRGSPGMEMPDGTKDAFKVLAFDAAGKTRTFAY